MSILVKFEWPKITDPQGELRDYIAYPGTCVPHDPHGSTVPSSDGKILKITYTCMSYFSGISTSQLRFFLIMQSRRSWMDKRRINYLLR